MAFRKTLISFEQKTVCCSIGRGQQSLAASKHYEGARVARVVSRQSVLPLEPSHTLWGLGSSTSGGYLRVDTSFSYGGSSSRIPPSVNWFGIPLTFVQIEHQLVCVTACRVALQSFRRCCHTLLNSCHPFSLHPLLNPAKLSFHQPNSLLASSSH